MNPTASMVCVTLPILFVLLAVAGEAQPNDSAAAAPAPTVEASGTASDRLADTVKDAVKGAVKNALDGTLKDKATEAVTNALTTPAEDGSTETKIVLRISKDFIRQHAPPVVEHVAPVNKCLFGSRVPGTALLPEEDSKLGAPIEVWVHGKLGDGTAAKVVTIWSAVHFGLDKFCDAAPPRAAKLEDIKPAIVGDWWVLRVGADLVEGLIDQLQKDEAGS